MTTTESSLLPMVIAMRRVRMHIVTGSTRLLPGHLLAQAAFVFFAITLPADRRAEVQLETKVLCPASA